MWTSIVCSPYGQWLKRYRSRAVEPARSPSKLVLVAPRHTRLGLYISIGLYDCADAWLALRKALFTAGKYLCVNVWPVLCGSRLSHAYPEATLHSLAYER